MKTMVKLLLASVILLQGHAVVAQCNYTSLLEAGKALCAVQKYPEAIKKFNAARTCDPSKTTEVTREIDRAFASIIKQRDEMKTDRQHTEKVLSYFGFSQNRAWAYKNGKFALIDDSGKQLTEFEFTNPEPFNDRKFAKALKNGAYYLINLKGHKTGPFKYILPASNGGYKVKKGNRCTFFNADFAPLGPWQWYEAIDTFDRGVARFEDGGRSGLIHWTGKVLIPAAYDRILLRPDSLVLLGRAIGGQHRSSETQEATEGDLSESVNEASGASDALYWGLATRSGRIILEPQFDMISEFINGLSVFTTETGKGMLDLNGNIVLPAQYNDIRWLSNDRIAVRLPLSTDPGNPVSRGTWSILDLDMNVLQDLGEVDLGKAFMSEGFILLNQGWSDYQYITPAGQLLPTPPIQRTCGFDGGVAAMLGQDNAFYLLDTTGRILAKVDCDEIEVFNADEYAKIHPRKARNISTVEQRYEPTEYSPSFRDFNKSSFFGNRDPALARFVSDNRIIIRKDSLYGVIDRAGRVVVPPRYGHITHFRNGVALISQGKYCGLIDTAGRVLAQPQFTDYYLTMAEDGRFDFLLNGHVLVAKDNRWGLLDTLGRQVVPCRYAIADKEISGDVYARLIGRSLGSKAEFRDGTTLIYDTTRTGELRVGFLNVNGFVIEPQYKKVLPFRDSVTWVQDSTEQWSLIDLHGNVLSKLEFPYATASPYEHGICHSTDYAGRHFFLDRQGKPLGDGDWDEIYEVQIAEPKLDFQSTAEGIEVTKVRDAETSFVLPGGFMKVRKDGFWGLIDVRGDTVLSCRYEDIQVTEGSPYFRVQQHNKWGVAVRGDTLIVDFVCDKIGASNIYNYDYLAENIIALGANGKWGYYNIDERLEIPPQFDESDLFRNGTAVVKRFEEVFKINRHGEIVVK